MEFLCCNSVALSLSLSLSLKMGWAHCYDAGGNISSSHNKLCNSESSLSLSQAGHSKVSLSADMMAIYVGITEHTSPTHTDPVTSPRVPDVS